MTEPARRRKVSGGCPPGVQARGPCVWGCLVGASAAPSSADFDPPGRTAPAGRGGSQPRALYGLPAGGGAVGDHRRRGGGEAATRAAPTRIVGDSQAGWVRVLGEPPAWGEPASRRGGLAPGAVTSTGRRPGASEAGPAPASPPSCGARSETFVRHPLDQFFLEFWDLPFSSHPGPHRRARRVGEAGGARWR